jgi:hypothetical protein
MEILEENRGGQYTLWVEHYYLGVNIVQHAVVSGTQEARSRCMFVRHEPLRAEDLDISFSTTRLGVLDGS